MTSNEKVYVLVAVDKRVYGDLAYEAVAQALELNMFRDQFAVADVTDLVRTESQHTLPGEVYLGGICELR